jgi:hypothetical protein
MNFDKESVYDEQLAPLMTQILEICEANEIPMIADFFLKRDEEQGDLHCTSALAHYPHTPAKTKKLVDEARPRKAWAVGVVIRKDLS